MAFTCELLLVQKSFEILTKVYEKFRSSLAAVISTLAYTCPEFGTNSMTKFVKVSRPNLDWPKFSHFYAGIFEKFAKLLFSRGLIEDENIGRKKKQTPLVIKTLLFRDICITAGYCAYLSLIIYNMLKPCTFLYCFFFLHSIYFADLWNYLIPLFFIYCFTFNTTILSFFCCCSFSLYLSFRSKEHIREESEFLLDATDCEF